MSQLIGHLWCKQYLKMIKNYISNIFGWRSFEECILLKLAKAFYRALTFRKEQPLFVF